MTLTCRKIIHVYQQHEIYKENYHKYDNCTENDINNILLL
jgi:hypothetical protein